jgi:DNA primase
MISLETVREFVYSNFPKVSASKGGTHFHARCSLCGDSKKTLSKKRFHIDWNNGDPIYHCFNCGASGSFIHLYSVIKGVTIQEAKKQLTKYDPDEIKKELNGWKHNGEVKESIIQNHNYILEDCVSADEANPGFMAKTLQSELKKFILERKIPENIKLFAAITGRYRGRIIIPIYDKDTIVYFQGRAIMKSTEPKYLNPIVEKSCIILNKDNFERSKYIIVTEGLLDAFTIGHQGTTILGADLTEAFVEKIKPLTDKGVIIALDNDETGIKKLEKILKEGYSNNLRFFIMPTKYKHIKDLNELVVKGDVEDIYEFVVSNSHNKFETQIKIKL